MPERIQLLYLDDYHAGDVLFVQSLSRALARIKDRRAILLHGSGEHAERALEAQGVFRERVGGILPIESADEHALVDHAIRHANRKLTSILTDAVVPAVGVIGSDRRLLRIHEGQLEAHNADWIASLARRGVVPVVAALAIEEISGRTGEVPLVDAVIAIAENIESDVVAFTKTNLPGIMKGDRPESVIGADALNEQVVDDSTALRTIVTHGIDVLLTNTTRLADTGGAVGTRVRI